MDAQVGLLIKVSQPCHSHPPEKKGVDPHSVKGNSHMGQELCNQGPNSGVDAQVRLLVKVRQPCDSHTHGTVQTPSIKGSCHRDEEL